ncbi:MAG TPA: glycosyltransferase family 2 protein [Opitutus sp.]|nr:glycosyltransferase family 2 protein [Opitutus sp.]
MKLVAVSVVKNEADIIEAFVRHTRVWVDEHLIFDHDSTDGTRQILRELVHEGFPLRLYTGDAVANLQQSRSNYLARLAFTERAADWVLPLDADEFLVARDRPALEMALANGPADQPASLLLRNYSPTTADDSAEINPVQRIRHRQHGAGSTCKVFVPRALGLREDVVAGKGNHALYQQSEHVPARALPEAFLAHFALRSPHQQVLRVLTAELQKLSRGKAHEGLDTHYRLGFQLLAEDADLFFSTVLQPPERLRLDPIRYLGGALVYSPKVSALARSARALVPYLEKLARSHGELVDQKAIGGQPAEESIVPLEPTQISPMLDLGAETFSGFTPISGWQPEEGPIPEAFLPRFHWATGPETTLSISATTARAAQVHAQVLSYAEQQQATVLLNGVELSKLIFPRVNQKENWMIPLTLEAGENHLVIRHSTWIESAADPRKLALIFLSLRVVMS